ncbi:MAG: saccharopine dehydrogenase NADP-binding domain-containing protein [Candidatus Eisenbacteria bacterium]|nr:saccharopine dehydrogenase NADP-binding domain-containing protein [Candidatus Eisenbacteria bacterium]
MNILVLGGGAQGRVLASDLARSMPAARINVADLRRPELPRLPNIEFTEADCSSVETVARLLRDHDLGVGALPSRFGFGAMQAAIEARRDLVDVSFCAEDPLTLDAAARKAGVAILPDCGLAPGLSNLAVGRSFAVGGPFDEAVIYVGGVTQDPTKPYGYVITWSPDDLLEEYTRPARVLRGGREVSFPVFTEMETLEVPGVGTMEAFTSDGLRTLITTLPGAKEMAEKTLRWPGHVAAIQPLLKSGRLVEEFRARCAEVPPNDLVAFLVRVRRDKRVETFSMVDRYDPATGLSAMARTTALTTSVTAQLAAARAVRERGVLPLEHVARDAAAYDFIVGALDRRGVKLVHTP